MTESPNEHEADVRKMLGVVEEMMARTRTTVVDRSAHYFVWGALVFVACVVTYVLGSGESGAVGWFPWAILMPLGAVVSVVLHVRDRKRSRVLSYAEHAYDGVWLAIGMGASVVAVGNAVVPYFPPEAMYVMVSVLVGVAVFASGHIMGMVSFKLSGVLWWGGAVIMMLLSSEYYPLVLAAIIVPGYFVPGYLLRRSVRSTQRVAGVANETA